VQAVLSPSSGYTVQGCPRPSSESFRAKIGLKVAALVSVLPLFRRAQEVASARTCPSAAGQVRPQAAPLLSMVHSDTVDFPNGLSVPLVPKKKPTVSIWKGGALGRLPAIPNNHKRSLTEDREKKKPAPRSIITYLTDAVRRRLCRFCATFDTSAVLYTGALTLCAPFRNLAPALIKGAFLALGHRYTAKCQRDPLFARVGFVFKQELQEAGALHFHAIAGGGSPAEQRIVWLWICGQWVDLLFALPGVDLGNEVEERWKTNWWHSRDRNWTKIRGNFYAYFAKYLGKAERQMVLEAPIPGKWWTCWNKSALPIMEEQTLELPAPVAVFSQRVARKIRQVRADDCHHRQVCRQIKYVNDKTGEPMVSQQAMTEYLQRLKRGQIDRMHMSRIDSDCRYAVHLATAMGLRFGRYKFRASMTFSSVTLIGEHVPAMIVRILSYAGNRARDLQNNPF
jgi:hypothetical protein